MMDCGWWESKNIKGNLELEVRSASSADESQRLKNAVCG